MPCVNAIVFTRHMFELSPKILYVVNAIVIISKFFGIVDSKVLKIIHI